MSPATSGAPAVRAVGLVKRYGPLRALDSLDLDIPRGALCGLVGPNGAGKTTAFSALAGLLGLDAGRVDLFGEGPFDAARHAGRVSLMPQDSAPSPYASLLQILCFYAELQGLSRRDARREADEWLGRVRLGDRAGHRLGQLSHGMRRRLNLAQALMGRPELILLDEPTAGLDPELAAEVRGLLSERRGLATIVVSSHVLSELEELCDHVVFMERGRQVQQGSMRSMRRASGLVRLRLSTEPNLDRLRAEIGDLPCEWQAPELRVTVDDSMSPEAHNARILRALLDAGVGVLRLELGESLEAAYLASRRAR